VPAEFVCPISGELMSGPRGTDGALKVTIDTWSTRAGWDLLHRWWRWRTVVQVVEAEICCTGADPLEEDDGTVGVTLVSLIHMTRLITCLRANCWNLKSEFKF
jgi:hypothetical protein